LKRDHVNVEQFKYLIFTFSKYSTQKLKLQLYPAIPPPDIPPNSLIATNLLCTKFFSYIKPLIHPLYRHLPHIFMYEQDYFIEKNESNTATKEASIRDKADPVTICWLMPTRPSLRNSVDSRETAIYSFIK